MTGYEPNLPRFTHRVVVILTMSLALKFCMGRMLAQRPEGIDSDFQTSAPNWSRVAKDGIYGIQFTCIKATALDEGLTNTSDGLRQFSWNHEGVSPCLVPIVNAQMFYRILQ